MTIQERLRRSNFIMLVVPVLIAGMLLLIGLGVLLALLETIYLPRDPAGAARSGGEKLEPAFQWLKWFLFCMGRSCSLPCWPTWFWGLPLGRWFCTAAAGRKRG